MKSEDEVEFRKKAVDLTKKGNDSIIGNIGICFKCGDEKSIFILCIKNEKAFIISNREKRNDIWMKRIFNFL